MIHEFKIWWLLHINLLVVIKFSIKKCTVEVKYINLSIILRGNKENDTEGSKFSNRCKHYKVVNTLNLDEFLRNKSGLVLVNNSAQLLFNPQDPFRTNNVPVIGLRHKLHVPASISVLISSSIAAFHHGQSACFSNTGSMALNSEIVAAMTILT